MSNTIQPLDTIRITQKVKASLIIQYSTPFTDAIDIEIAPETTLLSSVYNFDARDEYLFLLKDGQDHHELLEFYKYDIPKGALLNCSFKISNTELSGRFQVLKAFDYIDLSPDLGNHIFLLANLYFHETQESVSADKWSSFVKDFAPLQKIIGDYKDILITSNEAINAIASEIQRQVYLAKSNNTASKFPSIFKKD